MMNAQRQLAQRALPDLVEEPRTNKQRLRNDIITKLLMAKQCQWRSDEVPSMGNSLVQALTDTLWTVDGHHDVFSKQGCLFPSFASEFEGYNRPEMSKHRKRNRENMSCSTLKSLYTHLFDCLQFPYWEWENWKALKPDMEKLAQALLSYTTYLQKSNKRVLLNHMHPSPVRQIADNITFQFLPRCLTGGSSQLKVLSDKLIASDVFEYIAIESEDYCPTDSHEKYNFIKAIKSQGFPLHTVLPLYCIIYRCNSCMEVTVKLSLHARLLRYPWPFGCLCGMD